MNLNSIVSGTIAAVNPPISGTFLKSTGYTTSDDGTRVPSYAAPMPVSAQVQALQYNDMTQVSGLNLNGERRAIYLNGNWDSVSRPDNKGGDLITLSDGSVWLTALVLENWSLADGWVKIAVTRQSL